MPIDPPGALLGRGRAADVYDLGDGRVLRRYRTDHDSEPEAAAHRHLTAHGYPVPAVHEVDGRDMVMDLVPGPLMLDVLGHRPWKVGAFGRQLGSLQRTLAAVPVPERSTIQELPSERPGVGRSVLHLDLHPGNVILSPHGPVVIDWSNVRIGDPADDVAATWVLLAAAVPPGGRIEQLATKAFRARFLKGYLETVDAAAARSRLRAACDRRLADPNTLEVERGPLHDLARSVEP